MMEKENFLSGYCRALDASRMVEVITDDNELQEVDCDFGTCPHQSSCLIAKSIVELTNQS